MQQQKFLLPHSALLAKSPSGHLVDTFPLIQEVFSSVPLFVPQPTPFVFSVLLSLEYRFSQIVLLDQQKRHRPLLLHRSIPLNQIRIVESR